MGDVYLAEDIVLRRKVALKVLPTNLAADSERLLRFEREAHAASALSHPNILTIFEFGTAGETHFLASEYVEGETLRERLNRESLTASETVEITIQIASALQAAHEIGIIHRDIKPDNVMIRRDGYVKVLDFGLAKLTDPEAQPHQQVQTQAGIIMGTVAYMSPEQARAKEVDTRTDLFSLGVVFYEMLTRKQPFTGETMNHTIVAILEKDAPSLAETGGYFPPDAERVVAKCLAKAVSKRYQTAKELLGDLKNLQMRLMIDAELQKTSDSGIRTEAQTQIIKRESTVSSSGSRTSIAVLPFSNMSADAENEHFCDGLAEELLNALSKVDNLNVAARTSAFAFKGKNSNISEIGSALGVKTVLEGSVRKSGNRLRISVQLVNASDGYHLWSERYDREMHDIFDVQDEITLAVVDALRVKLLGDEKEAVLKRHTENAEAYQHYLRGRFFFYKRTPEGFRKAIECFQQAIDIDPDYAVAVSGLADSYTFLGFYEVISPAEAEVQVKDLVIRGLALDDTLAETRISSALWQSICRWDFAAGDQEHKKAIACNPKYALAHHLDSATLILIRPSEAIDAERRAVELEPFTPIFSASLGWWYYLSRRNDESIDQSLKTIEIAPNHFFAHWVLGKAYGVAGRFSESISILKKAISQTTGNQHILGELGRIYALSGQSEEALQVLAELTELSNKHYVSAVNIAKVYVGLGDTEKVFEWLEKAVEEHSIKLPWFMIDPAVDQFRSDPRFTDVLRRVGLPE
jgi:serine/threonine-protein kinase